MKDPKERVLSWRAEIYAELEDARKAIRPLQIASETAAVEARTTAENYRDTQILLGAGTPERLEHPLMLRADAHRVEVDQASNRRARAHVDLEVARAKVATLERALAQIDRIIAAQKEAA